MRLTEPVEPSCFSADQIGGAAEQIRRQGLCISAHRRQPMSLRCVRTQRRRLRRRRITAYDMNKGTIAWQIANGDTPANVKNNPLLQGLSVPKTGSPRLVGLMVTKTLLFAGDGTNPFLHAYDKKTGEDIAQIPMPGMQ